MKSVIQNHSRISLVIVTTLLTILSTLLIVFVCYNIMGVPVRQTEILVGVVAPLLIASTFTWYLFGVLKQLEQALSKVRLLSGLIPICASCKKIRDDKGYWTQVELYIKRHSMAEFTHGMCPECAAKLYPDFEKNSGE